MLFSGISPVILRIIILIQFIISHIDSIGIRGDRPRWGWCFGRDFASFHADLHFCGKYTTPCPAK